MEGYRSLYEVNEYIHDASDEDFLGFVVQVTGLEPTSSTTKSIIGSFNALKGFAMSDKVDVVEDEDENDSGDSGEKERGKGQAVLSKGLGLSYTINLNLPATSDIKVFDAIFRSLKEHLLK